LADHFRRIPDHFHPGGNTVICEGNKGRVFEVTPGGDTVREFVSPHFVQSEQFGRHN